MPSIISFLSNAMYVVVAVLVLLFMITVHELGHYIAGKILKFKINEFSIGFGPAVIKRTNKKTGGVFAVRIIPLGGYCAFEGEDQDGNENPRSFNKQKGWKRLIVLFSGAFANFIVSIVLILALFVFGGVNTIKVDGVYNVAEGHQIETPSGNEDKNGFEEGDLILKIDGKYTYLQSISDIIEKKQINEPISVQVYRNNKVEKITVYKATFYEYDASGNIKTDKNGDKITFVGIGIKPALGNMHYGFFESIGIAFSYIFDLIVFIFTILWRLITFQQSLFAMSGPISTIGITAQVASSGVRNLVDIAGLIGINLAVFNLIPFPALDGAKMTFVGIEMIRKKPINRKIEAAIHAFGLLFLFSFVIFIDILKLFV